METALTQSNALHEAFSPEVIAEQRAKFKGKRKANFREGVFIRLDSNLIINQSSEFVLSRQNGGDPQLFEIMLSSASIRGRVSPLTMFAYATSVNEDAIALSQLMRDEEVIVLCYGKVRAVYLNGDRIKVHDMMEFSSFEGYELERAYRYTKFWDSELKSWI